MALPNPKVVEDLKSERRPAVAQGGGGRGDGGDDLRVRVAVLEHQVQNLPTKDDVRGIVQGIMDESLAPIKEHYATKENVREIVNECLIPIKEQFATKEEVRGIVQEIVDESLAPIKEHYATKEDVRIIMNECLAPIKEHYPTKTWILLSFFSAVAFLVGAGLAIANILL